MVLAGIDMDVADGSVGSGSICGLRPEAQCKTVKFFQSQLSDNVESIP